MFFKWCTARPLPGELVNHQKHRVLPEISDSPGLGICLLISAQLTLMTCELGKGLSNLTYVVNGVPDVCHVTYHGFKVLNLSLNYSNYECMGIMVSFSIHHKFPSFLDELVGSAF